MYAGHGTAGGVVHVLEGGIPGQVIGQSFLNQQVENLVNVVCNTGVDAFVLISGWFGIRRKRVRFLDLVLTSVAYVFATQLYVTRFDNPWEAFRTGYRAVFAYENWFVGCYLLLYLVAPWINRLVETLSRESFRALVLTLVVAVGVVPTFFDAPNGSVIYWHGKCFAWLTTVYVIGRYLRRCHEGDVSRRVATAMFALPLAILFALPLAATVAHRLLSGGWGKVYAYVWCGDCSPFMLCGAIGLFFLFRSLSFASRWVNYVSGSVFAVFLTNGLMKRLDADVFGVADSATSPWLALLVVGEVVAVFVLGVAFDKAYRRLFRWPHEKAIALASTAYDRLRPLLFRYVSRL